MGKRKNSKNILSELVKSEESIREKYKKLKLSKADADSILQESLRPISEPLNTLVKSSKAVQNITEFINKSKKEISNEENKKVFDKSIDKEVYTEHSDEENKDEEEKENDEEEHKDTSDSEKPLTSQQQNYEDAVARFGPISKKYFLMHLEGNNSDLDKSYGIYSDGKRWYLGDTEIQISKDSIFFKDDVYNGTPGLFELLFLKAPDDNIYDEKDLDIYKKLLLESNAYKQRYDASKQINSNRGIKYVNVVRDLMSKKGSSVHLQSLRYEYWDDPNELVDRLRLLVASNQAGNNGVNNEILSIIEELKECNIIE